MKSVVNWFNDEKGFGFIEYKNNGEIHILCSDAKNDSSEGTIDFSLIESEDGYIVQEMEVKEN